MTLRHDRECDEGFHSALRADPVALMLLGLSPSNGRRWATSGGECYRAGCCPLCTTYIMAILYREAD